MPLLQIPREKGDYDTITRLLIIPDRSSSLKLWIEEKRDASSGGTKNTIVRTTRTKKPLLEFQSSSVIIDPVSPADDRQKSENELVPQRKAAITKHREFHRIFMLRTTDLASERVIRWRERLVRFEGPRTDTSLWQPNSGQTQGILQPGKQAEPHARTLTMWTS